MRLLPRTRYGFQVMVELAMAHEEGAASLKTVTERADISAKYLEQVLALLRAGDLVRSVRGEHGGYVLGRSPADIHLSEIFAVLEGPLLSAECLKHPKSTPQCPDCMTRHVWQALQTRMMTTLASRTLQDIVKMAKPPAKGRKPRR